LAYALEHAQVTGALTGVEAALLSAKLSELEACLEPGLSRLNWNSRGIHSFVQNAMKSLQEFSSLLNSVQKSSRIIEKVVAGIAAAELVAELPSGTFRLGQIHITV
jgi:dynein heavy chain